MGNTCSCDESRATGAKANQETLNKSFGDGLRGPNQRIQKVDNQLSSPSREESNPDIEIPLSQSQPKEEFGTAKQWPDLEDLPEITNAEVNITLNRLGKYHYDDQEEFDLEQSDTGIARTDTRTPGFKVKVSMKMNHSDFLGIFEFPSQEVMDAYKRLEYVDFECAPWAMGKIVYHDGSVYEGTFRHGKFDGQGRIVHKNGDYYQGNFKNNLAEGQGKFASFIGEFYEGNWVNNLPHGKGKNISSKGEVYTGEFAAGKKEGQGQFVGIEYQYTGGFEDNKLSGHGTLIYNDHSGRSYVGDFLDGKFEGRGTYTYENGDKYIGEYSNGKKNGYGSFISKQSDVKYEGYWNNGLKHGTGRVLKNESVVVEGEWDEGNFIEA